MSLKAPFPYFGGKSRAASLIWSALGDVGGYVEPFCGSAAVLLARPSFTGRRVETINDADGWLINAWRSIRLSPNDVAEHASGPVAEVDYHARLAWLQERRTPDLVAWLEGDPEAHDVKAAGWWLYVSACGIGDPWGPGPWRVIDGHLRDARTLGTQARGINRELPHLGDAGQGVNRALPHLGDAGKLHGYMRALASRLHRVRITCGSWERVLKPSVIRATAGNGTIGVLLDPPYAISGDLYGSTNHGAHQDISGDVRAWCEANGDHYRVVLCGFDDDHDELLAQNWRKELGKSGGGAGYNTDAKAGRRERLWLSPACVDGQWALDFGEGA